MFHEHLLPLAGPAPQKRNGLRRLRGPNSERRLKFEALGKIPLGLFAFARGL